MPVNTHDPFGAHPGMWQNQLDFGQGLEADAGRGRPLPRKCTHPHPAKTKKRTIISADKTIAVLSLELSLHVLLRLLHGNVHEAVQAGQHA